MKAFCLVFFTVVGLIALLSCNTVDPAFSVEQRYKHDLFSSEAECRRMNPNPEMSCSEAVSFEADGRVDVLLGGGDIIVRSSYKREKKTITVNTAPGLPNQIVFKVGSETELVRADNNTRWLRY